MSSLTVAELKGKLRDRNMSTTGTKSELVKRLLDAGVSPDEIAAMGDASDEVDATAGGELAQGTTVEDAALSRREIELLRKECDLAAREIDLLKRELELARMTPQTIESTSSRRGVRKWQDLKDLVGEYHGNGLDYVQWERQIKKLLSSYELDEHKSKAFIVSRLAGKVLKWYHSRTDCVELSGDDLLRELKKMYGQRPDPLILRRELEARRWKADETFADYLNDKVTLANRVPVSEEETMSYIIDGIPDPGLRTQARVQRYDSVDAMLTAFANVSLPKEARKAKTQETEQQRAEGSGARRCYNCNEDGHITVECTKPRREKGSCFKCGKMGHRASQCGSPTEVIHWLTSERPEDDEGLQPVKLRISDKNSRSCMTCNARIDSGSPVSFVRDEYIPPVFVVADRESINFCGINSSRLRVTGCVRMTIGFENREYDITLRVVPSDTMRDPIVLGRDFMRLARLKISRDKDIAEIENIGTDNDGANAFSQKIQVNDDLPPEEKQIARDCEKILDELIEGGIRVETIADGRALDRALSESEANPRIVRWVVEAQRLENVSEHRSGPRMPHVDALDRRILVVADDSFDRNLAMCRDNDPMISEVRMNLERKEGKLGEPRDERMCRKHQGEIPLYVPTALESSIIVHGNRNRKNHVGAEKTTRSRLSYYQCPSMRPKIDRNEKSNSRFGEFVRVSEQTDSEESKHRNALVENRINR